MKLTRNEWVLLLILLLGLFVRIYFISGQSLWFDEGYSVRMSQLSPREIISKTASADYHPPLYYIVLHYWVSLFGTSEFSVRLPSAILGICSILILYKVGKHLFNDNVGILSSLILAVSVFHVEYSQEVRSYSLMAFMTLLSFYFFLKLFNEKNLRSSVGYIISSAVLMYTHVYGLFFILSQNIYFIANKLFSRGKTISAGKWVSLQGILLILFLPWTNSFLAQTAKVQRGYWVTEPTLLSVIYTFGGYAGSRLLLFFFLIFVGLALTRRGKILPELKEASNLGETQSLKRGMSQHEALYLLFLWLSVPVVLPFLISYVSHPIFISRGTIGSSLAFYLLAAKGIDTLPKKYFKPACIALVVILSLSNIWVYYHRVYKDPWREVARTVDMTAKSGDMVLFNSSLCQYLFSYYSKRPDLIKMSLSEISGNGNEEDIKQMESLSTRHDRVWLIVSHGKGTGWLKQVFRKSYTLSYYKEYSIERNVGNYVVIRVSLFEK
jgi:mannosyltransferase